MDIIKNIALDILNGLSILVNGLWSIWIYLTNTYSRETYQYGKEKHQKLDLYLPKNEVDAKKSLIIYAHGGGWIVGSRKNIPPALWAQLDRGYIIASVTYCLLPKYNFPEPVNDLIIAHQWLKERADELSIDSNHMIGWGLSAGAQIVNYAALKHGLFSAVISWYGFSDLAMSDPKYFHPITRRLIKSYVHNNQVNATEFITKDSPSFYLIHGELDRYVPCDQSRRLHNALQGSENPSRLILYPRYYHGDWRLNYAHSLSQINIFLDQVTGQ